MEKREKIRPTARAWFRVVLKNGQRFITDEAGNVHPEWEE